MDRLELVRSLNDRLEAAENELAVGWDRVPHFPYSTDADAVKHRRERKDEPDVLERFHHDALNAPQYLDLMQTSGNTDSLELAVLVSELEQHTGKDPFASSIPEFRTISDLARLYVD